MDWEVPEYLAGAGDEYWPRELDDGRYYFTELLELLRHCGGDAGAGSSEAAANGSVVEENPSPDLPPPSPLPTAAPKSTAGEAEMASWLCQVFDCDDDSSAADHVHDQPAATAGTPRDVYGLAAASGDTNNKAACCRGRRRGGRRSCSSGRAAEQRRRDKINDKMRTLQQLVPRCSNQTNKASTLEEVIQYVKSLQHQLQVMSTGYASVPTAIFPPGVVPPPCMQQGGGVFPAGRPTVMTLHPYPLVPPVVFACPHPSNNGMPPPTSRQFVHHSHLVPSVDLAATHGSFLADENRRRKRK